jgi:hypothetical protein
MRHIQTGQPENHGQQAGDDDDDYRRPARVTGMDQAPRNPTRRGTGQDEPQRDHPGCHAGNDSPHLGAGARQPLLVDRAMEPQRQKRRALDLVHHTIPLDLARPVLHGTLTFSPPEAARLA